MSETIDISDSPNRTLYDPKCEEMEVYKSLSNSLKKDKKSMVKIPLQVLEENTLGSKLQNSTKKKKKRKNNKKSVQTAVSQKTIDSENVKQTNEISPEILERKEKKVPASYEKLIMRHEELKTSVGNSRQSFSAYKVSTFFNFNSEFIKDYGDSLSKIEHAVKDMEYFLGKAVLKEKNKVASPKIGSKTVANIVPKHEVSDSEIKEVCQTTNSNSRSKNNQTDKSTSQSPSKKSRKRKIVFPSPAAETSSEKRGKKLRKCTVRTPVAILTTTSLIDINAVSEGNKDTINGNTEDDSDSEPTKEGEYEVRKIQDYIRRQGGFFYRVSWRGYESDEDTFEPADHLDGCEEALKLFFYLRLKARENVTSAEEFKKFPLPNDERRKELLYQAFEQLASSLPKSTRDEGIRYVASSKSPSVKSKEELQEDILKFLTLKDPTIDRYKKSYTSIIQQISYREIYQDRSKQLADLRAWERSMNIICSDPAPLYVENYVDLALPPLDFIYINEYVPGPDIIIPNDPIVGCDCKECNQLQKSCCSNLMNSHFAYNKHGRLRVSLGTPIYECNKACICSTDCINRVVQHGRKISLAIFRTSNDRGWGVKTLEPIKKDQFVSEYVGEVISSDEAEQRGMKYDTKGCTYLFDLDYNKGDQNPYTVDAYKYGNVSHFINHSCDPNLVVYNVWVNCLDPDLPKLALFAARDIKKGEEITFDYNSGSTRQISIMDKIDDMNDSFPVTPTKQRQDEDGDTIIPTTEIVRKTPRRVFSAGKTECRCGAANCRSYFF